MESQYYYLNLYSNIHLSLAITAFIADVLLFFSIVSFRCLNARFHYNLLKHCCCIDATCLALITISQRLFYNISYDISVASCTVTIIVCVLYFAYYSTLFLIAIDWTLSIYNRKFSEKLHSKKNCITATIYLFIVFAMCFGARTCVWPNGEQEVYDLIVTGEFFVFLIVVVGIAGTHMVKCRRDGNLGRYSSFPLQICLVGFLLWAWQFVNSMLYLLDLVETNVHVVYLSVFLGTCTPVVFLVMCLMCDKVYRGCLQYACGCKAYDELIDSRDIQMEEC